MELEKKEGKKGQNTTCSEKLPPPVSLWGPKAGFTPLPTAKVPSPRGAAQ